MSQGYQTAPQGNGLAVTALVLGILGVLVSWIPCVGWVLGLLFAVLAIIFGFVGKSKASQGAPYGGVAIAGLATGFLALIIAIGVPLWIFVVAKGEIDKQGGIQGIMEKAKDEAQKQMDESQRQMEVQLKQQKQMEDDGQRQKEEQLKQMELQIETHKQSDEPTAKPAEPSKDSPPGKTDNP